MILGSLTGCYSPESRTTIPVTAASFDELKQTLVQLRGLSLTRDITLMHEAPKAVARESDSPFTEPYGPAPIGQMEHVYKRIGLLPESTDFAKALADYRRLEQMVFYDASKASVAIGPEAYRLGQVFSLSNPRAAQEIPAVFGITQALQEQNFHWNERLKSIFSEDRRLAFRALAGGDATLVAMTHANGEKKVPTAPVDIQFIGRLGGELEKSAHHLPQLLRQTLVFPYREGGQFVLWAYAAKSWDGVNALYADPPLSTSQILHPERYYVRRENPVRIFPWGLMSQMKNSAVLEQTLGEAFVRLLISSVRSGQEVALIASAWRGDQLFAYQEGTHYVTAWISSWTNDAAARNFFYNYKQALERYHRIRLDSSSNRKDSVQADRDDGRSMVLQAKGSLVLFLDGLPSAQSLGLADVAWGDLETDTEPITTPFDRGQGPLHWSRRSR